MRRLSTMGLLVALGVGATSAFGLALWSAGPAAAQPTDQALDAGSCTPAIDEASVFRPSQDPDFTLEGTCFGTGAAFTATNSSVFRVTDLGAKGTLAELRPDLEDTAIPFDGVVKWWNACSSRTDAVNYHQANGVTCTVRQWTNVSIRLSGFSGLYGDYSFEVRKGDRLAVQVWNAQSGAGPAVVIVTAGGPAYFASLPAQAHKAGSGHAANSLVSSIGASLRTPSQAFSSAASVVVDAIIVLLMALFITFPSAVFNSTFQENYQDISAWWSKWLAILFPPRLRRALLAGWRWSKSEVLRALGLASASEGKKSERQWASFSLVLVVGSFLGALLDPSFGPNWRSVISYAAIVLAMATGVAVSGLVTGSYHRLRHHGKVPYKFEALPVGLAIATACVVVSRVTGFQPGYLYGVICGVAFGRELREHEEGHVVALGSVVKVVLAVAAWFAWDGVQHYATRSGSFFGAVLLDDFLASLFVSSLVGTVISLFPLRFLPGHKLQSWHKGAWAATLLVSLFVLVQVLLRPHGAGGPSHTPLVTTLVLFAVFGGGSVLFRQHFVRKRRREAALAPAGEGTEVVDVTDAARKAPAPPAPVGVPDAAAPAGAAPSP